MDPPMDKDDQDRTSARRPSRENLARIQQSDDKQRLPAEEAESSHPTRGTIVEMPELQLFDLVAGGAFERALEDMGQQHHGAEARAECGRGFPASVHHHQPLRRTFFCFLFFAESAIEVILRQTATLALPQQDGCGLCARKIRERNTNASHR